MPNWTPKPEWQDQDAIIVGGGASLCNFDFKCLTGKNTIGCNEAYQLGSSLIKLVLFSDVSFWEKNKDKLVKFEGRVVTCSPLVLTCPIPWLLQMRRIRDGLHEGNILGWNYSTGAAAVNLAVSLGATRIFLLGFDMGAQSTGRSHWHHAYENTTKVEAYRRFIRGFHNVAASLRRYPQVEVINVTDGSSLLPAFPRMGFPMFEALLQKGREL